MKKTANLQWRNNGATALTLNARLIVEGMALSEATVVVPAYGQAVSQHTLDFTRTGTYAVFVEAQVAQATVFSGQAANLVISSITEQGGAQVRLMYGFVQNQWNWYWVKLSDVSQALASGLNNVIAPGYNEGDIISPEVALWPGGPLVRVQITLAAYYTTEGVVV